MDDAPPAIFAPENLCHAKFLDHRTPVRRVLEPDRLAQNDICEVLPRVSGDFLMRSHPVGVLRCDPIQPLAHLRPAPGDRTAQAPRQRDVFAMGPQRLERARLPIHELYLRSFHGGEYRVKARVARRWRRGL
jgi:hypothetical protein